MSIYTDPKHGESFPDAESFEDVENQFYPDSKVFHSVPHDDVDTVEEKKERNECLMIICMLLFVAMFSALLMLGWWVLWAIAKQPSNWKGGCNITSSKNPPFLPFPKYSGPNCLNSTTWRHFTIITSLWMGPLVVFWCIFFWVVMIASSSSRVESGNYYDQF